MTGEVKNEGHPLKVLIVGSDPCSYSNKSVSVKHFKKVTTKY